MRLCDWDEGKVCTKEGEDVSIVKEEERSDTWVHQKTIKERVHQILEIASNSICVFCREEEW